MKHAWVKHIGVTAAGLALAGIIAYAFWPQPVPVDLATIERGPLQVSVNEDGKTRIRERYTISAPLSGRLLRVGLDPGDDVQRGQLLLVIEPSDPTLLDARSRAEAQARVSAARSAVNQTSADLERVAATLAMAERDYQEQERLLERGSTTSKERDDAASLVQVRTQEQAAARFAVEVARYQLDLAEAALLHTRAGTDEPTDAGQLEIKAPCDGRVLRVFQESEGFINAGAPLLEFGDTNDLEAVIDVLSTDAVKIRPGDSVRIEHWGGGQTINARVRVVEPAAFTKVSSLGVEEQRVNIIVDFTDPPDARRGLGDGFRIEASIIVWKEPDVLKAPTSALFKSGESWAVYQVRGGHAQLTPVTIGRRNGQAAQILSGLNVGDTVVSYPSDQINHGTAVIQR